MLYFLSVYWLNIKLISSSFFAIYSAGESRAKNSPAKPSDSSMSQLNRSSIDADPLSKTNHSLTNTSPGFENNDCLMAIVEDARVNRRNCHLLDRANAAFLSLVNISIQGQEYVKENSI